MRYHDITKCDMKNGDGLRAVLWVAGCSHRCPGCHNPITWDPDDGVEFDRAAEEEIFEELSKDYVSGITFSGGDPLFPGNREAVAGLIGKIKEKFPQKTVWLYTGYLWEDVKDLPGVSQVDVLVDGPYVEALRVTALHWKDSANQRVIDVPATLRQGQVVVWED